MKKFRISQFAKMIGRSASTIRRWEREGLIKSKRLVSGQRYFTEEDVKKVLGN